LVGRILKAKYFSRDSFLEAKLGNHPSFAWRSIFSAQDLIREGILWRIGNGETVRIWGDKWLPQPTTYKVQSPISVFPVNASISNLSDPISKWWNEALLISIFNKEEVDVILKIPISKYGHYDCMVWRGTASGELFVRSAYHLEKERREVTLGDCSYMPGCNPLWNLIWGMKFRIRLKCFCGGLAITFSLQKTI
jgi:hypothetical protein